MVTYNAHDPRTGRTKVTTPGWQFCVLCSATRQMIRK